MMGRENAVGIFRHASKLRISPERVGCFYRSQNKESWSNSMKRTKDEESCPAYEVPENSGVFVRMYPEGRGGTGHMMRESQAIFYSATGEDFGIDPHEPSASEKIILCSLVQPAPELPFPMQPLETWCGRPEVEYVIPDDARGDLLEALYPFDPCPKLDDIKYDIHEEKFFMVKEFKVLRFKDRNLLASPFYGHSGGMVVDWLDEDDALEGTAVNVVKGKTE